METNSLKFRVRSFIETMESRVMLSAAPAAIHINAGGGFYSDSAGRGFAPDAGFTGGTAVSSPVHDVLNTDDDPLFLTYRSGAHFAFSQTVANGNYALWLEFAEPDQAAGQRTFDVSAEGNQILDNFDIAAAAGANTAIAKTFNVNVSDGKIDLSFDGVSGDAIVSAVVLVPLDPTPAAQPYSWLNLDNAERQSLSKRNLQNLGQLAFIYSNEHKGFYPASLKSAYADYWPVLTMSTFADPRNDTMIPRGTLSGLEQISWAAALDDFIYLGAGKKSSMPATDVLGYENPQNVAGDINVLLGDGSVVLMDRATAAAKIGFSPADPANPPTFPPAVSKDPLILQSQANIALIQNAAWQYANSNRQIFPSKLGVLFQFYHVPLSAFINPRSGTVAPPDSWTVQQKVDWINANSDYLFPAAGKRTSFDPDSVFLYENPAHLNDGINISFGDRRIEFRETGWAMETLAPIAPPAVTAGAFNFDAPRQAIQISFSEDVYTSLSASDLVLRNITTGQTIAPDMLAMSYDFTAHSATWTYLGQADGILPDGNYSASLIANSVTDETAHALPSDFNLDFFVLAGDANRDRKVDMVDLQIILNNLGGPGRTFSQGDFNYDGRVDGADALVWGFNWGKTLAPPPAVAVLRLASRRAMA